MCRSALSQALLIVFVVPISILRTQYLTLCRQLSVITLLLATTTWGVPSSPATPHGKYTWICSMPSSSATIYLLKSRISRKTIAVFIIWEGSVVGAV
ncbi:hypothetical protein DFH29DRAFT_936859 [Suillus ampliporus]|nr:hypothetical protein DFH29DRAFT_936859 [Suillus ampliporus]